jgi:hypothetical protein
MPRAVRPRALLSRYRRHSARGATPARSPAKRALLLDVITCALRPYAAAYGSAETIAALAMDALGFTAGIDTAVPLDVRQILQQPLVWSDIAAADGAAVCSSRTRCSRATCILSPVREPPFVGECGAALTRRPPRRVEAIATTDIVAGPAAWLRAHRRCW